MKIPPRMHSHQVRRRDSDNPDDDEDNNIIIDHPEFMFNPGSDDEASTADYIPEDEHSLTTVDEQSPELTGRPQDSLPILEAFQHFLDEGFQDFLDKERVKMRRKLVTFTLFVVGLIFALGAVGIFLGLRLFNPIKNEVEGIQDDVIAYQLESRENRKETATAIKQFTSDMSKEKKSMTRIRDEIKGHVSNYDGDIVKLKKLTIALKKRNVSLRNELDTMKSTFPTMAKNIDIMISEINSMKSPTGNIFTDTPRSPSAPAYSENLEISVATKHSGFATIRLPLP